MNFYTSLLVGTLVFLIITLIIVGYCMTLSGEKQIYPPSIADCPDYYTLDSNNTCYAGSSLKVYDTPDISCNMQNFTTPKYSVSGTNFSSGLCAKKLWANDCEVKWDGITNNDTLCYA
jgi:hypothetical protein